MALDKNGRGIVNGHKIAPEVDLFFADLSGADLQGADLTGARLQNTNLSGANLSNAKFHGAYMVSADLEGADLDRASFTGANLSGADLCQAINLEHVRSFTGANLMSIAVEEHQVGIIEDIVEKQASDVLQSLRISIAGQGFRAGLIPYGKHRTSNPRLHHRRYYGR